MLLRNNPTIAATHSERRILLHYSAFIDKNTQAIKCTNENLHCYRHHRRHQQRRRARIISIFAPITTAAIKAEAIVDVVFVAAAVTETATFLLRLLLACAAFAVGCQEPLERRVVLRRSRPLAPFDGKSICYSLLRERQQPTLVSRGHLSVERRPSDTGERRRAHRAVSCCL